MRITYHDACHLSHGQNIRSKPRQVLQSIPGLELVELDQSDWCCGAAGAYSLQHPEMASRLASRKLEYIAKTGADTVAVSNAGCILHLAQYALLQDRGISIVHPVDLLDRAYRNGTE